MIGFRSCARACLFLDMWDLGVRSTWYFRTSSSVLAAISAGTGIGCDDGAASRWVAWVVLIRLSVSKRSWILG